jgi:osmotically-inducible protein OsmY
MGAAMRRSRTSRSTTGTGTRAARTRATARTTLLLVGPPDETASVAPALASLRVRVQQQDYASFDADAEPPALGVVLIGLRSLAPARAVLRQLADAQRARAPLYVVADDATGDRPLRELYQLGAAGVFLWPRESLLLPRYLAEMLAIRQVRGKPRRSDAALERVVRTRLRMVRGISRAPRVEVSDGVVQISGRVATLAARQRIEEASAAVAGVTQLDLSGLSVVPTTPTSDRELGMRLRRLLSASEGIDPDTLALSIDHGLVTLGGSVESKAALRQLQARVAQLEGVRAIEPHVVISSAQRQRDHDTARRLSAVIADIFPEASDARVTFFGGAAILQGRVPSLEMKRSLASFVDEHPAVRRVVNKLDVRR